MPSPGPPDIVARRLKRLTDNDLRFLVENFPEPAASYGDIARIFASLPTTLDSALDAEYVYRKIFENRRELLEICRVGYRDAASTRLGLQAGGRLFASCASVRPLP